MGVTTPCNQLATTKIKTDCTKTADATTGTIGKCCLATFTTAPKSPKADGSSDITVASAGAGGVLDGTSFYGCYKTGGSIRWIPGTGAEDAGTECWSTAADFCGSTKVGKAQAYQAYRKTLATGTAVAANDGSRRMLATADKAGLAGTANTCVCGASGMFSIGFSLLAILALFWK